MFTDGHGLNGGLLDRAQELVDHGDVGFGLFFVGVVAGLLEHREARSGDALDDRLRTGRRDLVETADGHQGGRLYAVQVGAAVNESTDGSHEVVYYAENSVGVTGVPQTCYLNVDQTPPTTATQGLQTSSTTGWTTTSPQTVTLSPSDLTSGVTGGAAVTYYSIDGGARQTYSAPFQVSGDGSHTVEYWSVDAAGNVEQHGGTSGANVGYVNIDAAPPLVSDNADGAWHNGQVSVTVNADDGANGSGVATTSWRPAGSSTWTTVSGPQATIPVAAPADGSNDGLHTFDYQATDNAGNPSAIAQCTVKIDTQGPIVTNDADAYWHNSAVTVTLQASDAGAGVSQLSYRLQGATAWTTTAATQTTVDVPLPGNGQPQSVTYEYTASDALGNATPVGSFTVNLDPTMPNTIVHGLPSAPWVDRAVSLTFSATPGSGAPIARTEYSLDAGATWTPIATGVPLVFRTAGQATVLYRSVNTAGTIETPARSATVRIDLGKPVCLALKNVAVKAKALAKLGYQIKDASPSCGTAKVTITIYLKKKVVKRITIVKARTNRKLTYAFKVKLKKGKYTWKVSATDSAGNRQSRIGARTLTVR